MPSQSFDCITFSQYDQPGIADDLLLFAAPAKTLYQWAGIPRKAWHIRMLFQRPVTNSRAADLKRFWEDASSGKHGAILGPTAIVLAIQNAPVLSDGKIDLSYTPIVDLEKPAIDNLPTLVNTLLPKVIERLSSEQLALVEEFRNAPTESLPTVDHDYVLEFALQMIQMQNDPEKFIQANGINEAQLNDIVISMEALSRPAIVVDGQHRLFGAASAEKEINLPVIAIPRCSWIDQIYQFIVINETAEKVETSLLTDIFGSSLTRTEQTKVRDKLNASGVEVESRIAAVIASRDPSSPFFNVVQLKMSGTPPDNFRPYLSERTIRVLIDGSSQRFSSGWRTDDDFYKSFVSPTFPDRQAWDSWTNGLWREYWIAFWDEIRHFYNDQATKLLKPLLWRSDQQTNLTKGVTLRQMQSLFMAKCVAQMDEIARMADILRETLGEDEAEVKLSELRGKRALPSTIDGFREYVRTFFLDRGVPVKVFLATWKGSLDDSQGQLELWETLELAFDRSKKGERFHVSGRIFVATDDDKQ